MSMRTKLIFLLLIPLMAFLVFSGRDVAEAQQSASQNEHVENLTHLAIHMSNLIHESQKERGFTAGYLGSGGVRFGSELVGQQRLVDERVKAFVSFLKNHEELPESLNTQLELAQKQLESISNIRMSVRDQNIDAKDAIGFYTRLNASLLDSISDIAHESNNPSLSRELVAYSNFLKSKERAGIERAVLANTFAADQFGPGMYAKFLALVEAQRSYEDSFLSVASTESVQAFRDIEQRPAFQAVRDFRTIALNSAETGGFGVDASAWFETSTDRINALKEIEDSISGSLLEQAGSLKAEAFTVIVTTFCILVATVVGGVFMIRNVIRPIRSIVVAIDTISNGDFTVDLPENRKDEIGDISISINQMTRSLSGVITDILNTSNEVAAASTEIAASAEEMSHGLRTQESQTQQVAAAVEQMSSSVAEVASRTADASAAAGHSQGLAEEGGKIVSVTVETMETISDEVDQSAKTVNSLGEKSKTIGEIISVINDIADQTNLLALNAAIEAARAGEHGRGFAVVADEVRKLSERTQIATEEISNSIRGIQSETQSAVTRIESGSERVSEGVELATQAGDALTTIVDSSIELQMMVQSISAAANEQSSASSEIARAVEGINQVTRESTEGASQSAAAASDLARQAESLQSLVVQFKISES